METRQIKRNIKLAGRTFDNLLGKVLDPEMNHKERREAIARTILPKPEDFNKQTFSKSIGCTTTVLDKRMLAADLVWGPTKHTYTYYRSERNREIFKVMHLEGWDYASISARMQKLGASARLTPAAVKWLERVEFNLDDHSGCKIPRGTQKIHRQEDRINDAFARWEHTRKKHAKDQVPYDCPIDPRGSATYVTAEENLRLWCLVRTTGESEKKLLDLYGSSGHNWLAYKKWTWLTAHWYENYSATEKKFARMRKEVDTANKKYEDLRAKTRNA